MKKIERVLFLFQDSEGNLKDLSHKYYGLGNLYKRLLSEIYQGKKIQFINITLATKEKYEKFPQIPQEHIHYYIPAPGYLEYHGVINIKEFNELSIYQKKILLWNIAFENLQKAAEKFNNIELLEAVKYAYKKGLDSYLDEDYRVIDTDILLHGFSLKAAVWLRFKENAMYSYFTLEKNSNIIFEKELDNVALGNEFFIECFKKIEVKNSTIVVKGHYALEYLPLKIKVSEEDINMLCK